MTLKTKRWLMSLPLALLPFTVVPSQADAGEVAGCVVSFFEGPSTDCTTALVRPPDFDSTPIFDTAPFPFPADLFTGGGDAPLEEHFINLIGVPMTDFHIHWEVPVPEASFDFAVDTGLFDLFDVMTVDIGGDLLGVTGIWFDTLFAPGGEPRDELLLLTDGSLVTVGNSEIIINASIDVPEPGTLAILGVGLAGLGFMRRKQLKA